MHRFSIRFEIARITCGKSDVVWRAYKVDSCIEMTHAFLNVVHQQAVTKVAHTAAIPANTGSKVPSIPIEVRVAKRPPAGVRPPYNMDWKAAARVPLSI